MLQAATRTKRQEQSIKNTWIKKDAGYAVRDEALGCQRLRGRTLACSLDQLKPMPAGTRS
jgi:hypothetical protein